MDVLNGIGNFTTQFFLIEFNLVTPQHVTVIADRQYSFQCHAECRYDKTHNKNSDSDIQTLNNANADAIP